MERERVLQEECMKTNWTKGQRTIVPITPSLLPVERIGLPHLGKVLHSTVLFCPFLHSTSLYYTALYSLVI